MTTVESLLLRVETLERQVEKLVANTFPIKSEEKPFSYKHNFWQDRWFSGTGKRINE